MFFFTYLETAIDVQRILFYLFCSISFHKFRKGIDFILHAKCVELLCHLDQTRPLDKFNNTVLIFWNRQTSITYICRGRLSEKNLKNN